MTHFLDHLRVNGEMCTSLMLTRRWRTRLHEKLYYKMF